MDFFLDTGIFLGRDHRDTHHEPVNAFLTKYPHPDNRYFSAEAVKEELQEKRRQCTRKGWSGVEIRRVWQIIFKFQNSIEYFVCYEDENKKHPHFDSLYASFYPIVEQDYFDATILANAFIWSCEKSAELSKPFLVTVDDTHFYKQKEQIYEIVHNCTGRDLILKIRCAWDDF